MNEDHIPPGPEPARRVAPITPLLNAWKAATALIAIVVWQGRDVVVDTKLPLLWVVLIFLAVVIGAAIASLIYNYFAWRRLSYGFDTESIYLHSGILFRTQRHVRLDRVQSVDLNRPLLARVFGYVSLNVVSAGSGSDKLTLAYVSDEEAARLRNEILARAAGLAPSTDSAPAPEAPEHQLLAITPGRIMGSLLRSGSFITGIVVIVGLITAAVILRDVSVILALAIPLVASGSFWWRGISRQFDFTVATSPDGIRLRYGLLSTVSRTVPPGRVQAVQFTQPLLWRRKDWWKVTLTVAGEGVSAEAGEPLLYPAATSEEAHALLYLILPDLGVQDPLALIDAAMRGIGSDGGFVSSPRRVRWIDPLVHRRTGYRATNTATLIRRGRLRRTSSFIPNARIQSLGVSQGPIERRLQVANVRLHTTPGPVIATVPHLDTGDAHAFIRDASARARLARKSAGPERWMEENPSIPAGGYS